MCKLGGVRVKNVTAELARSVKSHPKYGFGHIPSELCRQSSSIRRIAILMLGVCWKCLLCRYANDNLSLQKFSKQRYRSSINNSISLLTVYFFSKLTTYGKLHNPNYDWYAFMLRIQTLSEIMYLKEIYIYFECLHIIHAYLSLPYILVSPTLSSCVIISNHFRV